MDELLKGVPFSSEKLDRLMGQAGIDILVASSKHNVSYLLGGHRHHFFEAMDAVGVSRYLPLLVYQKGHPDRAAYIANRNEKDAIAVRSQEGRPLWPAEIMPIASGTLEAMSAAIEYLKKLGVAGQRIGVEAAFLPWDAGQLLQTAFPEHPLRDALFPLERLRAVKTAAELAILRRASDLVVDAMMAVMMSARPGVTKRQILDTLKLGEIGRGLAFDYGLVTLGTGRNRAPSDERLESGDILSLDSGGNLESASISVGM
jgi:Xaa-Pro aminopeptidase